MIRCQKKLLEENGICPVATTIDLLSSKWKVLIIRDLLPGTKRFTQLKTSVAGISQKMLTQSLREMEHDGLVVRQIFPVVPLKVEYSLSKLGRSMENQSLIRWQNGEIFILIKIQINAKNYLNKTLINQNILR